MIHMGSAVRRSARSISLTRYQQVRSRQCWKVWLGKRLRESRYLLA